MMAPVLEFLQILIILTVQMSLWLNQTYLPFRGILVMILLIATTTNSNKY